MSISRGLQFKFISNTNCNIAGAGCSKKNTLKMDLVCLKDEHFYFN